MSKLWIIARKDIREAFRSRSTYIYIALLIVLSFSYVSTYISLINQIKENHGTQATLLQASQVFLNSLVYTLPLWYAVFICTIFATYSVIVDKAKRNLESLMATPVSLKIIWMAKTLAVTLPSIIIAFIVAFIAYVLINLAVVIPDVGSFVAPSPIAIFTSIVLIPLLIFAIAALVIYLQLVISNPRIANFAFTAVFLLLFFGGSFLGRTGMELSFGLIYIGLIIVCGIVAYFLSRSLTKEKVVLSSKG
jgi:ABC-2 type transport system permease protein